MSFFVSKTDCQIGIYKTSGSSLTGFRSEFKDTQHPATEKKIAGFSFDKFTWKSDVENNDQLSEPMLWNGSTHSIKHLMQSGIGDNEDLKVQSVNKQSSEWSPELNHGYFYIKDEEYYLFSDSSLSEIVKSNSVWVSDLNLTSSGGNTSTLDFNPKGGIPILARSFEWDYDNGVYKVFDSANKVVDFTYLLNADEDELPVKSGDEFLWDNISTAGLEFVLENYENTLRAVFNKQVSTKVGLPLATLSGFNTSELEIMELSGATSGEENQEIHTKFSPVDPTAAIQIVVENGLIAQEYSIVESFTSSGLLEVIVDYDLGILKFGSSAAGGLPTAGQNVRTSYNRTLMLEYEPSHTSDIAVNQFASLNPVSRFSPNGFVFIKNKSNDPASIELAADLIEIEEDYFGPLYLGNDFSKLLATVLDTDGLPIEAQEVNFELTVGPSTITIGNGTTSSAITNAAGIAKTIVTPPRNVNEMGGVTDVVTTVSGESTLFLSDYFPPTDTSSLFLFAVHTEDDILGIPKAELINFYNDYIQEQDTVSGQVFGPKIDINIDSLGSYSWITGAFADFIKWEILHRTFNQLTTPTTYDVGDLRTGKKTVIAELDTFAINPHTGTTPAFSSVQPDTFLITDSGTYCSFDTALPAIGSTYKSYLVIGPLVATFRASTLNSRTGQTIYSNSVDVLIDIPESATGSIYVDAINSVPSGLLSNAYFWDQENIELESVNITSSGLLPIGWRLRSPGITIASALDSITFLDINPLTTPDDTIDHEFIVEVI